jgi:hypothetical protein
MKEEEDEEVVGGRTRNGEGIKRWRREFRRMSQT